MSGTRMDVCETILSLGGLIGYNYGDMNHINEGVEHFGMLYLSETTSTFNTRGIYSTIENGGDKKHDGNYHTTSYDTSFSGHGVPIHRTLWRVLNHDHISGQFIWTGYDYMGEPAPWNGGSGSKTGKGPVPNSSYLGAFDTANFLKDNYFYIELN